jgi:hypothetical protein
VTRAHVAAACTSIVAGHSGATDDRRSTSREGAQEAHADPRLHDAARAASIVIGAFGRAYIFSTQARSMGASPSMPASRAQSSV